MERQKQYTSQINLRIHSCKTLSAETNQTHAHTGNTDTRPINSAGSTRPSTPVLQADAGSLMHIITS